MKEAQGGGYNRRSNSCLPLPLPPLYLVRARASASPENKKACVRLVSAAAARLSALHSDLPLLLLLLPALALAPPLLAAVVSFRSRPASSAPGCRCLFVRSFSLRLLFAAAGCFSFWCSAFAFAGLWCLCCCLSRCAVVSAVALALPRLAAVACSCSASRSCVSLLLGCGVCVVLWLAVLWCLSRLLCLCAVLAVCLSVLFCRGSAAARS